MNIRHQNYYTWRGRECRKIIEELTAGSRGPEGYYIGNIVKYLYRYKWKNGIEDLKKAEEYLHLLIAYNGKRADPPERHGKEIGNGIHRERGSSREAASAFQRENKNNIHAP